MRLGQAVSGLVGVIGALWLGIAGGYGAWWWDRRPAGYPSFETRVLMWPVKWTAPMSLKAQRDALQAQLDAATAQAARIGKAQAEAGRALAKDQARRQAQIRWREKIILQEVPVYVSADADARYPVPWGVVRVLDAAALGVRPSELPNPAGEPDDAASSVAASDLAAGVSANYVGVCEANAEQLRGLQAWVWSMGAIDAAGGALD